MVRKSLLVLPLLIAVAILPAAETTQDELTQRAAVIKPTPTENKWQQIPWITDVNEGLRQAKAEKRPLLLCTILGDPLDEC